MGPKRVGHTRGGRPRQAQAGPGAYSSHHSTMYVPKASERAARGLPGHVWRGISAAMAHHSHAPRGIATNAKQYRESKIGSSGDRGLSKGGHGRAREGTGGHVKPVARERLSLRIVVSSYRIETYKNFSKEFAFDANVAYIAITASEFARPNAP